MNTPNPLVPQGSFADQGKSQIRITVFAILAIHVVFLGLLLIAGCNKKPAGDQTADAGTAPIPPQPPEWPAGSTSAPPAVAVTPPENLTPPVPPPLNGIAPANLTPPGVVGGTPPPMPEATSPGTVAEHTISKGESFYTLGKKYGIGYKAIVDANPGINPNRLKIGDKVKIPAAKVAGTAAAGATAAPLATADGGHTYKVKSGDNLMKIAKAQGVSVKQLRTVNNLKTDQIKVGQVLKVPAKTPPPLETAAPSPAVPPVTPPLVPPPGITP